MSGLHLALKVGEQIHLTGGIIITLASTSKGKATLTFDAPHSIRVWRERKDDGRDSRPSPDHTESD